MITRIAMTLAFQLLPIVLFVAVIGLLVSLAWKGVNIWIEVSGPPHDESVTLDLKSVGSVEIFYPNVIRPDTEDQIHVDLSPAEAIPIPVLVTVTLQESSGFVYLPQSVVTGTLASTGVRERHQIDLAALNPLKPPLKVSIETEVSVDGSRTVTADSLPIRVDSWTRQVVAIVTVITGLAGAFAAIFVFAKSYLF